MEHKETIHSQDRLNGRKSLVRRQNAALTASKAHSRSKFEFAKRHSAVPARQKSAPASPTKTQSDRLLGEVAGDQEMTRGEILGRVAA
jgi:hypothetical protein